MRCIGLPRVNLENAPIERLGVIQRPLPVQLHSQGKRLIQIKDSPSGGFGRHGYRFR